MELIGRDVDRYHVISQLGQGGFGAVYRARHRLLATEVALKVLWPDRATDATHVERFLREARAAASLGSDHIARVLDAGAVDGIVFLAMQLLDGRDLESELRERRALPVGEAVAITLEVLAGLEVAHSRGIIHRDLKPANVFLARLPDGRRQVKLLDFGISKVVGAASLTATGMMIGTPAYMAPEQIESRDVDARADLYAVGVMLYEILSGRAPIEGAGYDVLVRRVSGEQAPALYSIAPHVPAALAEVVARATRTDRDARWPDASSMARALSDAAQGRMPAITAEAIPTAPPAGASTGPLAEPAAWQNAFPATHPAPPRPGSSAPATPGTGPLADASAWQAAYASTQPATPGPTRQPPLRPELPAAPRRSATPLAWAALGGLGAILLVGIGILGVLVFRLATRPDPAPSLTSSAPVEAPIVRSPTPIPSAPAPEPPSMPDPPPEPIPEATHDPEAPPAEAPSADPRAVRYRITSYVGRGPRREIEAVLDRARPEIARCARTGSATHVAIDFIATYQGEITIAGPSTSRHSDDTDVARCVAAAVREAGPAGFTGMQTAIVDADVDVPAAR